jgi:hypothetical protein
MQTYIHELYVYVFMNSNVCKRMYMRTMCMYLWRQTYANVCIRMQTYVLGIQSRHSSRKVNNGIMYALWMQHALWHSAKLTMLLLLVANGFMRATRQRYVILDTSVIYTMITQNINMHMCMYAYCYLYTYMYAHVHERMMIIKYVQHIWMYADFWLYT